MQRQFFIKLIFYEYVLAKSDPDEGIRCTIDQNMMPGKVYILQHILSYLTSMGM